ncbi:DUF7344 domain-containing protein [Natronorubrum daqingense]|uniref:DUF7344 domain-containing protein n=1 Tax=Natronorubrum daqingense TaxID=588898 RepID=A0A1N7DX54_9EURY|nr:hypothetical protein [Natronorubrum daqingense]APX96229.1 hypothetical protein BB347_06090 [Natronorubrum daqingense]SIR80368.1 hypothetical protein SAMN05421809_2301 [Natronorubrum daqingense]
MTPTAAEGHGSVTHAEGDDSGGEDETSLEPDDIYHILQTQRRRDVLRYLRRSDEPVVLSDLAEQVAAWEHETTVANLHSDQRQRVYISLYQSHLPKLDARGIIDYDKDRGTIRTNPPLEQFDPYLTGLEDSSSDNPWPFRYAGTVGCCGVATVVVASGTVSVPWSSVTAVILAAFALLTGVHTYTMWHTGETD